MGRFKEADLIIYDTTVSRQPAKFEYKDPNWFLTDENSTNGVFVNDKKIDSNIEYPLHDGDIVKLGPIDDYRWTFYSNPSKIDEVPSSSPPKSKRIRLDQLYETESLKSKMELERKDFRRKVLESERIQKTLNDEKEAITQDLGNATETIDRKTRKKRDENSKSAWKKITI